MNIVNVSYQPTNYYAIDIKYFLVTHLHPGHSDDSITLILDEVLAYTGDLHPRFVLPVEDAVSRASWDKIYQHKIT